MSLPKFFKKNSIKQKIALLLILCFLFSFLVSKPLLAYSSGESPVGYIYSFENAVFETDEMNLQSFVWETIKATTVSLIEMLTLCVRCSREEGNTYGLIPMVTGIIANIYTHPPASGVGYLAHLGQKLNPVPKTYAQDGPVGFTELIPYLRIWSAFRDIAYLFFVVIFVVIGFAIMFRVKISPQAVITIESALPKIIIALLLITFSYTIVGFMVDIMMVISNLIIFTFKGIPSNIPEALRGILPDASITDSRQFLQTIIGVGIPPAIMAFILMIPVGAIMILLGAGVAIAGAGPVAFAAGGIGAIVLGLLLAIILFLALLRVLWVLIQAYVMVVLSLIFSPFIILLGALPGSKALSGWFRNLVANLAVLPTVLVMVFLSGYLTLTAIFDVPRLGVLVEGYFTGVDPSTGAQVSPLTQLQGMQNIIGSSDWQSSLGAMLLLFLVSIAILLLTPRAAEIIQSFLAEKPFPYGTAVQEAVVKPISQVVSLAERAISAGAKLRGP